MAVAFQGMKCQLVVVASTEELLFDEDVLFEEEVLLPGNEEPLLDAEVLLPDEEGELAGDVEVVLMPSVSEPDEAEADVLVEKVQPVPVPDNEVVPVAPEPGSVVAEAVMLLNGPASEAVGDDPELPPVVARTPLTANDEENGDPVPVACPPVCVPLPGPVHGPHVPFEGEARLAKGSSVQVAFSGIPETVMVASAGLVVIVPLLVASAGEAVIVLFDHIPEEV